MPEQSPNQSSSSKKILLAGALVVATGAYALWQWTTGRAPATPSVEPATPSDTSSIRVGEPSPNAVKTLVYKDGTFTGAEVDAVYGIVQVAVVVTGGRIAEIKILKQPGGQPTTDKITRETMPKLVQEALTVQSARVDSISGATQTIDGFVASLTTALLKAQS